MSHPRTGILGWHQWLSLLYIYNNKTGSMLTQCSHTASPWLITTYYHSHHHIVNIWKLVHDKADSHTIWFWCQIPGGAWVPHSWDAYHSSRDHLYTEDKHHSPKALWGGQKEELDPYLFPYLITSPTSSPKSSLSTRYGCQHCLHQSCWCACI